MTSAAAGSAPWPVRVAAVGPVSVGSALWRCEGQLRITAIAKASFGFTLEGEARCTAPEPIRKQDECARGVPSLRGAAEVAPRMDRVDVVLVGHAYAAPAATSTEVRLTLHREGPILDKRLLVVGNRRRGQQPAPFERMRIGYERALGGLSCPDNPLGVGVDGDGEALPNVLDLAEPQRRVAGLGPIPASFPSRRALRGKLDPRALPDSIVEFPPGFRWDYFQAAPTDQRLEVLQGDEWLELSGLHPRKPLLRTRLASAQAVARIYAGRDVGAPSTVTLRADVLHIEPDESRLSIVYRGSFAVASELAAAELVIAGALALPGRPVQWPASFAEVEALASPRIDPSALRGAQPGELQATAIPSAPGAVHAPSPPAAASAPGRLNPPPEPRSQPGTVDIAPRGAQDPLGDGGAPWRQGGADDAGAGTPDATEWETTAEMDEEDHRRAEDPRRGKP